MLRLSALLLCFLGLHALAHAVRAEQTRPLREVLPAGYAFKDEFRVVPYGAFWGNMLYATQRVFPGEFTLFVFSEEEQGEDVFTTDSRRSRVGLYVDGPEIPIDGSLQSRGRVEVDFLGEFVTENQPQARLRHVYWEAKNDRQRLLVGLTWDVISPLYPRTVNFSVGWLGGNIGFRRAQFRYERFDLLSDDLAGTLQVSLNQDISPDFPTEPGVRRESSNYPVIQARAALTLYPEVGERAPTLGFSGHIGETGFDFVTAGPPPLNLPPQDDARFQTWSYNLDMAMPIGHRAHLQAEFIRGLNLSPFLGGIGQGVCPCTRTAIDSVGGWADLRYDWTERLSSHVGFGVDDPLNGDFQTGRTYNQFLFANLVLMLTPALSTGFEVSHWRTFYQDTRVGLVPPSELGPTAPGEAVTIDWMVKYEF